MANINYLRSVSPLFNVMSHVAAGDQILAGLGSGVVGGKRPSGAIAGGDAGGVGNPGETVTPAAGGGGGGPLSGNPLRSAVLGQDQPADPGGNAGEQQQAPLAGGASPTQYRPPTQVYQGKGKGFRDTTAEERSDYNQQWLGDRRNVGHGQGQVDPGLARAARMQERENSGGGNKGGK